MPIEAAQLIVIQNQVRLAIGELERGLGMTISDGARTVIQSLVSDSVIFDAQSWEREGIQLKQTEMVIGRIGEGLKQIAAAQRWTSVEGMKVVTANDFVASVNASWCKVFPFCKRNVE
jgi:hypothetical protein